MTAEDLPPRPDFMTLESHAANSAVKRTEVLALIGNIVFCWSNNESVFIYIMMILLQTDKLTASIVFSTLNTTRARLDLIERLSSSKITDEETRRRLSRIVNRFRKATKYRNEFTHSMYVLDEQGNITSTQTMRPSVSGGDLRLGFERAVDEARLRTMRKAVRDMTALNREMWDFLPDLRRQMQRARK